MRLISNAIRVAKEKDRIPNLTINIRDFEQHDSDNFCFYDPDTYPCDEFRISCKSVPKIKDNEQYIGIIVYSVGTYNAKRKTGHVILPGWMLI